MKCYLLLCLFLLCKSYASPFLRAAESALSTTVFIQTDCKKGCGFLIGNEGHVITLFHQIKDAKNIKVRLPSDTWVTAELRFGDLESDIAVLTIPIYDFPGSELDASFRIGEWVLSAGIPFSSQVSVKKGIIATLERKIEKDFVLVDFPFNPGELGGPIFNTAGKVIGMQFANTTTHDIFGVVIPSRTLLEVALKWGVFL